MRLNKLSVSGYRNLKTTDVYPHPTVNIIYGDNAQGKTNLVESIYLLTGQKSFRQSKDTELIAFGTEEAKIEAQFFCGQRDQEAQLYLGKKKKATLNEVDIQPSELTGRFYAVVFSPTELALIKDGPSARRSFLDNAISQIMPRYSKMVHNMNRALYQRNSLLTDMKYRQGMEETLEAWDKNFAKIAYGVMNARSRYVSRITPYAQSIYTGITGGKEEIKLVYHCSVQDYHMGVTSQQGEQLILDQLAKSRSEDIRNGHTTLGPHRDDLDIYINGISARNYGSQGQQRSCSLTLKLAECRVIKEIMGEDPIVLLDDVFSELDKGRRDFFINGMGEGQVFITSCDKTGIRGLNTGKVFRVKNGEINEVKKRNTRKQVK